MRGGARLQPRAERADLRRFASSPACGLAPSASESAAGRVVPFSPGEGAQAGDLESQGQFINYPYGLFS